MMMGLDLHWRRLGQSFSQLVMSRMAMKVFVMFHSITQPSNLIAISKMLSFGFRWSIYNCKDVINEVYLLMPVPLKVPPRQYLDCNLKICILHNLFSFNSNHFRTSYCQRAGSGPPK